MRSLILLLLLVSCTTQKTPPQQQQQPKPEPTVIVDDEPIVVKPGNSAREEIFEIVENSPDCSRYFWKNRGKAFMSYMRGMSLMYAKQVCGQGDDFIKKDKIREKFTIYSGSYPMNDALELYGIDGSQLNTYTFLIGLGMRESNGKYCKGRDKSRDFKKGESAEAGIFQMSYVARVFNERMPKIYKDYKEGKKSCELDVFKSDEFSCTDYDAKTYGSGEGRNFQELSKRCPAFAVEWAAILIRSQYKHFGPIIRREVEFRHQCRSMLEKVEKVAMVNCEKI